MGNKYGVNQIKHWQHVFFALINIETLETSDPFKPNLRSQNEEFSQNISALIMCAPE